MTAPISHLNDGSEQPAPAHSAPLDEAQDPWVRVALFALVVGGVVLGATWFVSATWAHFWGVSSWASQLLPLALTASFVPASVLGFRFRHPLLSILYRVSAVSLAFLNFFLVAALACWIVVGAAGMLGYHPDSRLLVSGVFGAAVLATLYGLGNAARLRTKKIIVQLPGLPAAWQGQEVALVSDVHLGHIRGARFARRLVAKLMRLRPRAIFITGDMFDGPRVDVESSTQPWAKLSAPAGVYFVSGNHDEFRDRTHYLQALEQAGLRVLHNEKVTVDGLQIVGVHDSETGNPQLFREILERAKIDPAQASILLAHQPRHLKIAEEAGVGLQLSGHTHAGQFWPWTLMIPKVHGRFGYGLNRFGRMLVHTTSGAGTWGPPIRVGTQSEIVLIRLEAAE